MATKVVGNYAHYKCSLSRYPRQLCIVRTFRHMCIQYPVRNRTACEVRTTFHPQVSMPNRSIHTVTSKISPRSSRVLCSPVVCTVVPFCLLDNYSTLPKRTRSRTHFYNVLKVTPNATHREIKAAYYELSKLYHPDINKDPEAQAMFSEISEAYEVLGNVRNRRLYDRGILNPLRYKGDDSEHEFHREEGFASKKGKPPTGHTSIYNFDEFYRQHYGESRRKQGADRANYEAYLKQLEDEENQKKTTYVVMMLLLSVGICLWYSALSHVPKPPPSEKRKGD